MRRAIRWGERKQVPLFLVAIAAGAGIGLLVPAASGAFEVAIMPVLGLLLYVTFLGVPFRRLGAALRGGRFLVVLLVLDFVVLPLVVFGLSRFVVHDHAVLLGVLLVLLTPCVDYVVVFAGLAGGAADRLLAATPVLMVGQILLLPGYLWLMAGPAALAAMDAAPIVSAFVWLIVVPLAAAAGTQRLARRRRPVRLFAEGAEATMVPLMMLTLVAVVASQLHAVSGAIDRLLVVVPLFVAFAALATVLALLTGRVGGLAVADRRALVFGGVTRNSLVVLPLALATPFALTPLVVVTQTLVELLVLVALVAVVPRLVRAAPREEA